MTIVMNQRKAKKRGLTRLLEEVIELPWVHKAKPHYTLGARALLVMTTLSVLFFDLDVLLLSVRL